MNRQWYAVYTKSQSEKKVAALLAKKRIEHLCPLNRITNGQGNRRKLVYEPLFPTFVFVYLSEAEMNEVRKTNDVINFVYWLGKPAVIKSQEIESIAQFAHHHYNITVTKTAVNAGGMVRISSASADEAGFEDTRQLKLTLPSLGYVLTADTDKDPVNTFPYLQEAFETDESRF